MRRAWFIFHIVLDVIIVALIAIFVIDSQTMTGERRLVGGSLATSADGSSASLVGSRIVGFPPILQGGRRAAVLDKEYYFCHRQTGNVFRIPRTYQTDFASIPSVARIIIDRFGSSLEPSTIHDWLYSVGEGYGSPDEGGRRAYADEVFLDALEDNDVGLATRTIMYWAVRVFGGAYYGGADEWDERFIDPTTGDDLEAPIEHPSSAVIATINCDSFQAQSEWLATCFTAEPPVPGGIVREGYCDAPPEMRDPA